MRKSVGFLVLNLVLGSAACLETTDPEDTGGDAGTGEGRGNGTVGPRGMGVNPGENDGSIALGDGSTSVPIGGDAGSSVAAGDDAGTPPNNNPGNNPANGGDPTAAPTVPATAAETGQARDRCDVEIARKSVACESPDVFEPNDDKASGLPLTITSGGCGLVPGKLSSRQDVDWYRFTVERGDPVLVDLAYETTASGGANLAFQVMDPMNGYATYNENDREALTWRMWNSFVANPGFAYDVKVWDRGQGGCQGYNLRVDPNFCTDAFEDNDKKATAAQGLTPGTKLSATVFGGDEDFYDFSAIQTAGATCTFEVDLNLNSTETIDFEFLNGQGGYVAYGELSGTSGTTTKAFTIKAASGASVLRVYSDKRVCTKYSVQCNSL